jgi:hypothetical protein
MRRAIVRALDEATVGDRERRFEAATLRALADP